MDFLRYANQGAVRNQPLAPDLAQALAFLPELGVEVEVFSGGQPAKGSGGGRVGSTRHDHGNAADVFFYKDGRRLDWSNPDDVPVFQQIVSRGKQAGLTGFGAGQGYMQPGSMHIGFGTPAVWGAGGKGANAPQWLREAYYGGSAPQPNSASATVSTKGQPMGGLMGLLGNQQQQPAQGQPQVTPEMASGIWGKLFPNMTADRADQLRIGMAGLSTRPNVGLMRSLQGEIEGRGQTAAEQRKMQQAQEMQAQEAAKEEQRRLRAVEFIKQQPNGEMFASAIMAGGDTNQIINSYLKTANASGDPSVQSSAMMPDQSGTVMTLRDGSLKVVTVGGETLTGDEAMSFVNNSQERAAELQRGIYDARQRGTLEARGDLEPELTRLNEEAKQAPGIAADYLSQAEMIGSTIRNMSSAIQAIDEGAESGVVYNMLPNITKASAELANAKQKLGLDIIGSVTFGALSEGEMKLAMDTAVPQDLGPVELKAWLTEKKAAQEKMHAAVVEASLHFANGGSMADYVAKYQSGGGTSGGSRLKFNPETRAFE